MDTRGWADKDGIRAQLRFDGHTVCLRSRPGRECSAEFPELAAIAEQLRSAGVILDGELVCFGTDARLRRRVHSSNDRPENWSPASVKGIPAGLRCS